MATRAKVTSVEAIESFRTNLLVYLSKARPALEEVSSDVNRTRMWLETDHRMFWEGQVRRRAKQLQEAQQALFSAEISNLRDVTSDERMALNKAKRALDEAEAKLRILKKWNREFSIQVEPLARQLGRLHTVLASDLPKAVAYLTQAIETLDAYAHTALPGIEAPVATETSGEIEPAKEETTETPAEANPAAAEEVVEKKEPATINEPNNKP